jgi:hypothetical protein
LTVLKGRVDTQYGLLLILFFSCGRWSSSQYYHSQCSASAGDVSGMARRYGHEMCCNHVDRAEPCYVHVILRPSILVLTRSHLSPYPPRRASHHSYDQPLPNTHKLGNSKAISYQCNRVGFRELLDWVESICGQEMETPLSFVRSCSPLYASD